MDAHKELVKRFNPSRWHSMLSRKTFVQKALFWGKKPYGALIRSAEFASFKAPLFSRLFTNNSLVNFGLTFGKVFKFLTVNTKTGASSSKANRNYYILESVVVDIENCFIKLHSGHFLSPFKSDRQFFSGMYVDDLRRLTRKKYGVGKKGKFFVLPIQVYYFHFLIEFLPRIIEACSAEKDVRVISTPHQPQFVKNALELLNIRFEEVNAKVLELEQVIVAEETQQFEMPFVRQILKEIELSDIVDIPSQIEWDNWQGRLLITRKEQPRFDRNLESELFDSLLHLGFQVIDPRDLNMKQQIFLFSQAKILVSFHGGALANMVFMPGGSKVFEIYAKAYDGFNPEFFKELASACEHEYFTFAKQHTDSLSDIIKKIRSNL